MNIDQVKNRSFTYFNSESKDDRDLTKMCMKIKNWEK